MSKKRSHKIVIDKRVREPAYKALMFRGWHRWAKCADADPLDYDTERRVSDAAAAELCDGCPVLASCAAEALHPLAVGTIRAGVVIRADKGPQVRRAARLRLQRIAAGWFEVARPGVGVES